MTAKAFVLIETAAGRTKEVTSALKQLQAVKSADPVTGPYDAIAVVEGESLTEVGELITSKFKDIPNIYRTVTCLAILE